MLRNNLKVELPEDYIDPTISRCLDVILAGILIITAAGLVVWL